MFLISDPTPEKNCNTLGHKRSLQSYDLLIQFRSQKKKEFSEKFAVRLVATVKTNI